MGGVRWDKIDRRPPQARWSARQTSLLAGNSEQTQHGRAREPTDAKSVGRGHLLLRVAEWTVTANATRRDVRHVVVVTLPLLASESGEFSLRLFVRFGAVA